MTSFCENYDVLVILVREDKQLLGYPIIGQGKLFNIYEMKPVPPSEDK